MWIVAELGFVLWIGLGAWWLWRQGPAGCLSGLIGLALAYSSAFTVVCVSDLVVQPFAANLWLRLASAGLVGSVTFLLVTRWWRQRGIGFRSHWAVALDGRVRGWLVLGSAQVAWVGGHLLVWVLAINLLAAAIPGARAAAQSSSLISGRLLGTTPGTTWERELDEQQRRLRGLSGGVDRILDATGTRQVMELMEAGSWIASLDSKELAQLVAASPELSRLTTEPAMLALIDDPVLMRQVDEAVRGSLSATYALGSEPVVIALLNNPTMREAIRVVDPVALRQRASIGSRPGSIDWELSHLGSSLELDARLAAADGWTSPSSDGFLAWEGDARFGVARARLTAAPESRRLRVLTEAPFSCWFAGQLLRPGGSSPHREVTLPASAGELVLLLDFAGVPQPHLCRLK